MRYDHLGQHPYPEDGSQCGPARIGDASPRVRALMLAGGRCERCGFNDMRALQFDHVNSDGSTDRFLRSVGSFTVPKLQMLYERLLRGELQVLCANCNWIKREERLEV